MAKKKIDQAQCMFCGEHPCACKKAGIGLHKPTPQVPSDSDKRAPDEES